MSGNAANAELHSLIDHVIDHQASDEEVGRLVERLEEDAEARRVYIGRLMVEAEMYALHADASGAPVEIPAAEAPTGQSAAGQTSSPAYAPPADAPPADAPLAGAGSAGRGGRLPSWVALAASLLMVAGVSSLLTFFVAHHSGSSSVAGAGGPTMLPGEPVARVTGTRDCRWSDGAGGVDYGDQLFAGQTLQLERGLVEVTFAGGARVVIEGPATFSANDQGAGELLSGRIAAAVPRSAAGFAMRTPRLAIADVGAQYGLVASRDGATEVHVFEGPVNAAVLDLYGHEASRLRLTASEAGRLAPASPAFARFQADGAGFVRTLAPTTGPTEGLLAFEEFNYPSGPLAWQNGGFGWAGPWAELEVATEGEEQRAASSNVVAVGSLAGCELISHGNRCLQTRQHNRVRRELSTSIGGAFESAGLIESRNGVSLIGRDGSTLYVSFLQRVSVKDDVFYGFELNRGDGNGNRVLSIGNGAEKTGYGVTSNYNGDSTFRPLFAPLGKEDTNAHLFVLRINFLADDKDEALVYRDPASLLDEGRCEVSARLRGNFAFDRINLGNFDGLKGKTHEVDEIRIGTSFTAVTGQRLSSDMRLTSRGDSFENGFKLRATSPRFPIVASQITPVGFTFHSLP